MINQEEGMWQKYILLFLRLNNFLFLKKKKRRKN